MVNFRLCCSISVSNLHFVIALCFPHKYIYTGMRKIFISRSSNIGKFGNSQGRLRKHGPWPINPHGTSSHTQENCTTFTVYDYILKDHSSKFLTEDDDRQFSLILICVCTNSTAQGPIAK
jgi:hypothetical protein